jgi:hypothetical protein
MGAMDVGDAGLLGALKHRPARGPLKPEVGESILRKALIADEGV